jgi:hypothetical protein
MAIVTRHLYSRVIGTHEVGLQVQVVVESDIPLVDRASGKCGKFRMAAVEVGNGSREMWLSIPSLEMGMALRTARLSRRRQAHRSSVFHMAGGAMRRETLIGMVHRTVVTGNTSFVAHLLEKNSSSSHMTKAALLSEDCVGLGKRAAGIDFLAPLNSLRQEPTDRDQRH